MDNTPLLDMLDWTCSRWQLEPKIAVGDAKYGTEPNIVGLENRGIKAYLPIPDLTKRSVFHDAYEIISEERTLPAWKELGRG